MTAGTTVASIPRGAAALLDIRRLAPSDAARITEILFVLARHGALVVVRRGPMLVIQPRRAAPRSIAVALRRSAADLGPTFVKFGQLIASSPGLFPEVLSSEFRSLLDRVPPLPFQTVSAIVERELGAKLDTRFATFDPEPLAAASIAQVHEAVLHDGRRVALKVRRPHLRGRIRRDVRLLRLLAHAIEQAGGVGELANPVAIVEDFGVTLRGELDFRNEAAAMRRFGANLRQSGRHDMVTVPEPIEGLITERVLAMTFVEGRPVDDVASLRASGHDLPALLRHGVRAWVEGALVDGFFHGDVHAGNLFVTREGRVAFLDFGITGALEPGTAAILREMLPALLMQDFRRVVRALFELGAATRPVDLEAAARDVSAVVTPLLGRSIGEIEYGDVLGQVLRVATRYQVRLPRELVLLVKQLLYFERYAKEMAPDYQILADPELLAILSRSQMPPTATSTEEEN